MFCLKFSRQKPGLLVKINVISGFPGGSAGKESTCNAGDLGLIPGLKRSPGEGNSCPLQYSGLENSVDCIIYGVTKSWTQLNDFHCLFIFKVPGQIRKCVKWVVTGQYLVLTPLLPCLVSWGKPSAVCSSEQGYMFHGFFEKITCQEYKEFDHISWPLLSIFYLDVLILKKICLSNFLEQERMFKYHIMISLYY